jgi:hypothetical protein
MISDYFIYTTDVRTMGREPEKIIPYISQNLRAIANIGKQMANECAAIGLGNQPPSMLEGAALDSALKMAACEAALSQISTHLAVACSVAMDNGIRPALALKDYNPSLGMDAELPKRLDEFGMLYDAYSKEETALGRHTKQSQRVSKSGPYDGKNPLCITWKYDADLGEQALRYVIAREAFETARASLVSCVAAQSYQVREV